MDMLYTTIILLIIKNKESLIKSQLEKIKKKLLKKMKQ